MDVRPEVIKHVFVDLLHLRGVDDKRFAFNRLHVGKFRVVDNHSALIVRRKVISREALPLFRDIFRFNHVRDLRKKADRRGIFNAVDNALILRVYQFHCRTERGVILPEEIVFVLEIR